MNNRMLTTSQAAEKLCVSENTVRTWESEGLISSFRAKKRGKRLFSEKDLDDFLRSGSEKDMGAIIENAKTWAFAPIPISISNDNLCKTIDVFQGRNEHMIIELKSKVDAHSYPLISLIISEIGNNCFNHNIFSWPDEMGAFFGCNYLGRSIAIGDRGSGLLKTLQRAKPELANDKQALAVAFTEYISGRVGEKRGNGLKSVRDTVVENAFRLEYYSGAAKLVLKQGDDKLNISDHDKPFHGCLAILYY